eukprot:symbB.v1.2.013309.t1/scaffold938.1/size150240/2
MSLHDFLMNLPFHRGHARPVQACFTSMRDSPFRTTGSTTCMAFGIESARWQPDGSFDELLTPCACRGSAGHVHAECLLEWCDHVGEYKKCDVCHQCFVGPAALLAARHRFRRAEALPEEDPEVLEATYQVAQALAAEGKNAEAAKLFEYLHGIYCRKKGETHLDTLALASSWALSLHFLQRHEEAAELQEITLFSLRDKVGNSHTRCVTESNNLALNIGVDYSCKQLGRQP